MFPRHDNHQGQRVVVADARQARLFDCGFDERDRLRLSETDAVSNDHKADRERDRPTLLRRGAPNAPQHTSETGRTEEEEMRRFARELAGWIRRAAQGRDAVGVFAGPRLLGMLRREFSGDGNKIDLREGDLTSFSEAELQDHPAMIETVRELRRRALRAAS